MGVNESDPAGAANLEKVDHVVVLMLENRSFDHMLGYLSLLGRRPEIDGLRPGLANEDQGRTYPVHHLASTALEMDPDHSASAIDQQVADGSMSGFVASAAATLTMRGVDDGDPGCVMGYYDGADVPVYDHLAEEFAVCDRWFSSVRGATLPNRLYALCGVAAGSRDDRPSTTRWRPARNGIVLCWSLSTTKTAASTTTSRRLRPLTMSPKCSAEPAQRGFLVLGWAVRFVPQRPVGASRGVRYDGSPAWFGRRRTGTSRFPGDRVSRRSAHLPRLRAIAFPG